MNSLWLGAATFDTLALFHCEEAQGDKLIDFSGHDNHGKIVGAKVVRPKEAVLPPLDIPGPPPLAEWLKGREVLTVSQDGKAQFKTIQAALDALKTGEVVKVLDRGPYKEALKLKDLPADVGLVSECRTILDFPEWSEINKVPDLTTVAGHSFWNINGFRLSGFAFAQAKTPEPLPANTVFITLFAHSASGLVVEDCAFLRKPATDRMMLGLQICGPGPDVGKPVVVRDCLFRNCRLQTMGWKGAPHPPLLIERNVIILPDGIEGCLVIDGVVSKTVVRRNIATRGHIRILLKDAGNLAEVSNNTLLGPVCGQMQKGDAEAEATIRNNILMTFQHADLSFNGLPAEDLRRQWRVGHNSYLVRPESLWKETLIYNADADLRDVPEFLSRDETDPNYLRLKTTSPLATGGAGGAWPEYVGALPPGPAPKEGDWFTRLRERWLDAIKVENPP